MTTPRKDEGRAATDRAPPKDTSSTPSHLAADPGVAINLRAWLIGVAPSVKRADVAMLALEVDGIA